MARAGVTAEVGLSVRLCREGVGTGMVVVAGRVFE